MAPHGVTSPLGLHPVKRPDLPDSRPPRPDEAQSRGGVNDSVLVVHHDLDLAGQEANSLRRFGYDVIECGGPTQNHCPVLAGRPCDLAERADVLVYDVWASGDAEGARTLIENIRDIHPDTPVVLTSPGLQLSWEESDRVGMP